MDNGLLYREQWVRGTRFISEDDYNERVGKDMKISGLKERALMIGNCMLPVSAETEHVFIIGKPGVGKSVLAYSIVEQLIDSGRKAVVYDFKGDFLSKFYDEKHDLIFNPLDERSVKWNIIDEITGAGDRMKISAAAKRICHSLIPESPDGRNENSSATVPGRSQGPFRISDK